MSFSLDHGIIYSGDLGYFLGTYLRYVTVFCKQIVQHTQRRL